MFEGGTVQECMAFKGSFIEGKRRKEKERCVKMSQVLTGGKDERNFLKKEQDRSAWRSREVL